jgi:hypothetical protein
LFRPLTCICFDFSNATTVVTEDADKKSKHFTNLFSSSKEKMASVSGDTRSLKLYIFYISGFSIFVISFPVNDDFDI